MKKKVCDFLKLFLLAVLLYFSTNDAFLTLAKKWFPDPPPDEFKERVNIMKHNFWKSCGLVFVFIALILTIQYRFFNTHFTTKHWFQVAGAFIALTAALGRGGWGIQTASGVTVPEKIDRGMFVVSELGATCILLFVLIF